MKLSSTKTVYGTWFVLGLLQVVLLSGCGRPSGAATDTQTVSQAGLTPVLPVRVSRSFFDAQIKGSIRVQGLAADDGLVGWSEAAVSEDHPGCATFSQSDGVKLCFNLMNDVDSFGVNSREMATSGIEAYLANRLGQPCPGIDWNISLAEASRFPATVSSRAVTSFVVQFTARAPADSGCASEPVSVVFSFQR